MENKADYEDTQHMLNRQINYTIIRRLWRHIKGVVEGSNSHENLYNAFPFTRNAYTLFVTGSTYQIPKINQTRRKKLIETGVSIEVFTGDIELSLYNITRDDWEQYFKYQYPDVDLDYDPSKRSDILKKMNTKLLNVFTSIKNYSRDSNLFKLYYYISNGKKYDGDEARYVLQDCMATFSKLTFEQWNFLSYDQLGIYETAIEQQLDMVRTLHSYKKYEKK